jgi:hypothetical protein
MTDKFEAYKDLLRFIDAFWSVLLGLSLGLFFQSFCPLCIEGKYELLPKCLLIGITLFFFIDDAIEARILTVLNPYKKLGRFYIEIFIATLLFFAINLADRLSRIYLFVMVLVFLMSILWSQLAVQEYNDENAEPLHFFLKFSQWWAVAAFALVLIASINYADKLNDVFIYLAFGIFIVWYFFYDILREIILKDSDFKGTGIFPARLIVKFFKFMVDYLRQMIYIKRYR